MPNIKFVAPKNIIHHELAKELNVEVIGSYTGHLWEQLDLPKYLKNKGHPLLVNLANTAPLFYKNKIATLHDVAFVRYPESFSRAFRVFYQLATPRTLKSSLKIITVSEFSKGEICSVYKIPEEKVVVIYNAVSDVFSGQEFSHKHINNAEPYIMAVSSINKQKNFYGLIKAFSMLNTSTHKLYIVGALNKNFSDPGLIEKIKADSRIKLLGRVSDQELTSLYKGASAFVYPSFYEGFGIPPLEAQACGCPVIVSNVASLPEVCGDSALYCSPFEVADIARQIERLLADTHLAQALSEKGYKNIARYSWESSATKLCKVIQEL